MGSGGFNDGAPARRPRGAAHGHPTGARGFPPPTTTATATAGRVGGGGAEPLGRRVRPPGSPRGPSAPDPGRTGDPPRVFKPPRRNALGTWRGGRVDGSWGRGGRPAPVANPTAGHPRTSTPIAAPPPFGSEKPRRCPPVTRGGGGGAAAAVGRTEEAEALPRPPPPPPPHRHPTAPRAGGGRRPSARGKPSRERSRGPRRGGGPDPPAHGGRRPRRRPPCRPRPETRRGLFRERCGEKSTGAGGRGRRRGVRAWCRGRARAPLPPGPLRTLLAVVAAGGPGWRAGPPAPHGSVGRKLGRAAGVAGRRRCLLR